MTNQKLWNHFIVHVFSGGVQSFIVCFSLSKQRKQYRWRQRLLSFFVHHVHKWIPPQVFEIVLAEAERKRKREKSSAYILTWTIGEDRFFIYDVEKSVINKIVAKLIIHFRCRTQVRNIFFFLLFWFCSRKTRSHVRFLLFSIPTMNGFTLNKSSSIGNVARRKMNRTLIKPIESWLPVLQEKKSFHRSLNETRQFLVFFPISWKASPELFFAMKI